MKRFALLLSIIPSLCFGSGIYNPGSGSGGGSTNGTINSSNQYSVGYYSGSGSTTTIDGLSPGTSGQVLVTRGTSLPPYWTTNVSTFTVSSFTATSITDSELSSGQCVQTTTGGKLTVTGSACGSGSVTSVTASNGVISSGGTTPNISVSSVSLSTQVVGTLPVGNGGTNQTTWNQGDMVIAPLANAIGSLAKNTTATRYVSNTGIANNPAWAQVNLSNGVTGTLADGSLSANVPLLNSTQTFTGGNTFSSATFVLVNGVTPSLVAGTNITSITGTWPNQTINAATQAGGGGAVYATTGSITSFPSSFTATVFNFDSTQFSATLQGPATAFITTTGLLTTSSASATYAQLKGSQTFSGSNIFSTIQAGPVYIASGTCEGQIYSAGASVSQYQVVILNAAGKIAPTTTATTAAYGVAQNNAVLDSTVAVCSIGVSNVLFDNTVTIGDLAGLSTVTAGNAVTFGAVSRSAIPISTGTLGTVIGACSGVNCTGMVSLDGIVRTGRQIPAAVISSGTLGSTVIASSLSLNSGSITAGTGISVTGSWPNNTITNTGSSYSVSVTSYVVGGSTNVYSIPATAKFIRVRLCGGGGGGGGGFGAAASTEGGGGGGGGGACNESIFNVATDFGVGSTSFTVRVATGGAGGVGAANNSPSAGAGGGTSSIYTWAGSTIMFAGAGTFGVGNSNNAVAGGSGGGTQGNGSTTSGGAPSTGVNIVGTGGAGGGTATAAAGKNSDWGGAGGGAGAAAGVGFAGGASVHGAGGGGGGGAGTLPATINQPAAGGMSGAGNGSVSGGGGSVGVSSTTACTAGGNGTDGNASIGGHGGGGGGSLISAGASATGCVGGKGGICGGGGGAGGAGGATATGTGGSGGNGGVGCAYIFAF